MYYVRISLSAFKYSLHMYSTKCYGTALSSIKNLVDKIDSGLFDVNNKYKTYNVIASPIYEYLCSEDIENSSFNITLSYMTVTTNIVLFSTVIKSKYRDIVSIL